MPRAGARLARPKTMKMPTILKRKKKLHAATARRARAAGMPDELDFEQMAEPNMKLSRALLIVLMLHVVAVAGIIAFNTIKTRQISMPPAPQPTAAATPNATIAAPVVANPAPALPNEITPAASHPTAKPMEKVAAHEKSPAKISAAPDSGKVYVVVKGDNPVTIARKLHVSYDALLELNQIDDPRKLQIGQKLRVPERSTTPKHKPE